MGWVQGRPTLPGFHWVYSGWWSAWGNLWAFYVREGGTVVADRSAQGHFFFEPDRVSQHFGPLPPPCPGPGWTAQKPNPDSGAMYTGIRFFWARVKGPGTLTVLAVGKACLGPFSRDVSGRFHGSLDNYDLFHPIERPQKPRDKSPGR
jgi:hypothetical protein